MPSESQRSEAAELRAKIYPVRNRHLPAYLLLDREPVSSAVGRHPASRFATALPCILLAPSYTSSKRLSQVTHHAPLLVIDGQQRLTTVALLLEALARAIGDEEPIAGFSAAKLRHY